MTQLDPERQETTVLTEEIRELLVYASELHKLTAFQWINATRIAVRFGILKERARRGDTIATKFLAHPFLPSDWKDWLRYG